MKRRLQWLAILIGLFAALSSVQAKRVAVLFGTNYTGNSAGIPPLGLCEKDAALMQSTLKSYGRFDDVKVYLGQMVTASNVEKAIEEVADETDEDDTVVFYFSGHGTFQRNKNAPDGMENIIVMFNRPHISESQLNEWLEEVESTKTVFVFDCCHSGGIARPGKQQRGVGDIPVGDGSSGVVLQNRNATRYFDKKVVVASSDANETSIELAGSINHGLFTYYFAQALNPSNGDLNKDKTVTIYEAFEWSKKRVTDTARRVNHSQNPQIIGDGSGIQIAGQFKPSPPAPQPGPTVVDPQPNPNPSPVGPPPNPVDPVDPVGPTEPEVVNHGEQGKIILATTILKSKYAVSSMNPNDIIGENDPHKIIG
ncbi:MAG: caspase family protein, partial [Leptospiraceae bacterium]|nr:caspase family protein [Leptospiraceae bacterium]